jgi:large subunit ribosomal protein L10
LTNNNVERRGGDYLLERREKEAFVSDMKNKLEKAQATFVVDYKGLNVEAINRLRGELRKIGTEFCVVKNRLLKLACLETQTESIKEHFQGPCALAITYDEVVEPAKILIGFEKEFENLAIKIGQMSGKPMDAVTIKKLAELPGRDQLLAQLLSAMQGVPSSFVRVLNGVLINFMNVLNAIGASREKESATS